jgi:hypothetical protein
MLSLPTEKMSAAWNGNEICYERGADFEETKGCRIQKVKISALYKKNNIIRLMAIVPNELEENESDTIKKILQNYKTNLNAEIFPERVQYHAEFFVEKLVIGKTAEDRK